jgi:hypothetical protein
LSPDFRRSKRFGIAGVFVVGALAAVIGLTWGSGADATGAMAAILAIVFAFVGALLILQRRDLEAAAARDEREALAAIQPVTDPTTADDHSLLASLAIKPIDQAALARARRATWAIGRSSISSAWPLIVLIACAVVPWQLFQWIWSIVVFVPLIVLYAGYLSARALGFGGSLDQAHEASAKMVEPLGLELVERRDGEVVYAGRRHGRRVSVRVGSGALTRVGGDYPPFTAPANGERLRADGHGPPAAAAVLEPLRASSYWKGVSIATDADGLVVERQRDGARHWMRDLWVAERLADSLNARA